MNRWLCLCAFWLSQLLTFAQTGAGAAYSDFDPTTPPNPDMPMVSHWLKLKASPSMAATFSTDSARYKMGTRIYVAAYPRTNYVFERWEENGVTVSTARTFYYDMPDRGVVLTAVFRFDPSVPANPERPFTKHILTLDADPWAAGYFNWNTTSVIPEDEPVTVTAYNRNSFYFKEWQQDGVTISTEPTYSFVMPTTDIRLVAIYEFAPELPSNPGANAFNELTGELIIDEFVPGGLLTAIQKRMGTSSINLQKVKSLTVIGVMTDSDWGAVRSCSSCSFVDVSRTTGTSAVPGYAFQYMSMLEEIILPASLKTIAYTAFYGCSKLETVTVHAITPPTLNYSTGFYNAPANLVVHVPAVSVAQYQNATGWKNYFIQPLRDEVSSLEVCLPTGSDAELYKDMYLELVNQQSGQRYRYVVTNRSTYTFTNLIHNTRYDVYLKNNADFVMGRISDVLIEDEDVSVTFQSLLMPRDISLHVITPDGQDVTSLTTITWTSADGTFLAQGDKLAAQIEGNSVSYHIILPQELAMQYLQPKNMAYTVQADNSLVWQLQPIGRHTLSGFVADEKTEEPLADATVAVSQQLNGLYSKAFTTKTDEQGRWTLLAYDEQAEISVSKVGYLSKSVSVEKGEVSVPAIELKDVNGTTIFLNHTFVDAKGVTHSNYSDLTNIAYEVYDYRTGKQITDLSVQDSKIVLLETLPLNTRLKVMAISKEGKFTSPASYAYVDTRNRASISLRLTELGGFRATYTSTTNTDVVGILYNSSGCMIRTIDYANKTVSAEHLPSGSYTLVSMARSQLFNSIYRLSQYYNMGLYSGSDYRSNHFYVYNGKTTQVNVSTIPYLNESKLYYTSSSSTFTVNKQQVTVGQYVTLNGRIYFKSGYESQMKDVKLIVEIPEGNTFIENSVMVGNNTAEYIRQDQKIIIPLAKYNERVRFCIVPTASGTYTPCASVQFTLDDITLTQPLGSAPFTVNDLSLNVPAVVSENIVPIGGETVGKSSVKVYVDDVLQAQTKALSTGFWATTVELENPEENSAHEVYVVITTPDGIEMRSETRNILYGHDLAQVASVNMIHSSYNLVYNFITPSVKANYYSYVPGRYSFSFNIDFRGNKSRLKNVWIEVRLTDGQWKQLTASYMQSKGIWYATGVFGKNPYSVVPVNVRVRYRLDNGIEVLVNNPGPATNVSIDPSGYVYEAVASNRVEGATATIYYKETVEDEYGDLHEDIVLWDAEEYAQQNPLFTDADGMYQWDVPPGLWQVKVEKDGYQTAYSAWLPVPPPQLDVNIPIVQLLQPTVQKASAFEEGIELTFSKYMDPATLTTDNIYVTRNDEPVKATVELLNEEPAQEGQQQTYASKVRLNVATDEELQSSDKVLLTVSREVKSYAGIPMDQDYTQQLEVEAKVRLIAVDSLVNMPFGTQRKLAVAALPADAAKGKRMVVKSLSESIATVSADTLLLDENGCAEVTVGGELPGSTLLHYTMTDSDIEGHTVLNVKEAEKMIAQSPTASCVSGVMLYRGTEIRLATETTDADIYYTLDGSEPSALSIRYDAEKPVIIDTDSMTIRAIAIAADLQQSEVATFAYTLKKTDVNYHLPKGWSWITHNLEQPVPLSVFQGVAEHILGADSKAAETPLTDGITELLPAQTYLLKVSEPTDIRLSGFEFNATAHRLDVKSGWNWIGYPLSRPTTPDEALDEHMASTGDLIVGQDGFAEYVNGKWTGTLEQLVPGHAYRYKSATNGTIVFSTANDPLQADTTAQSAATDGTAWTADIHAHRDVMPLTAQLYRGGTLVDSCEYLLAAFVGDECRGLATFMEKRLLMNIGGETDETITFKAMHTSTGTVYEVAEQMTFTDDNIGNWETPVVLSLGNELSAITGRDNDRLNVSPAVAADHITITAGNQAIDLVTLTNMGGQTVMKQTDMGWGGTLHISTLPEGMYVVTVKAGGQTFHKKILKTAK